MKSILRLLAVVLCASPAFAQAMQDILGNESIGASRPKINANFNSLQANKAPIDSPTFTGTVRVGAPATATGAPAGSVNFQGNLYQNGVLFSGSGGSMVYPGAGVPNSTGIAWGTSYTVGTGAGNLILGNDARLTDARTPLSHVHLIAGVTGLQTALDGKAASNASTTVNGQTCALGAACTIAGGGGAGIVSTAVTFSATPAFVVSSSSAQILTLALTGNVTSSTLTTTSATVGQEIVFVLTQDSTGGRTVALPSQVLNACTVSPTLSVTTTIRTLWDGTNANATACSTNDTPTLFSGPTRAAPSAPVAGLNMWYDNTANVPQAQDSAANRSTMIRAASTRTANQFVTYAPATGILATAAIVSADLPSSLSNRRTCTIENDTQSSTVLLTAQITGRCDVADASTLIEVSVYADAGTPTVLLERWRPNGGAVADLTSVTLPTGASGAYACAASGTACISGIAKSAVTLPNPALAAGDVIRVKSAVAGGAATWHHIDVVYTVN